jgi:arylsulfatase A-like enzyme
MRLLWRIALSALILTGSARSAEPSRPSVLVLLVDALRADHLGCYGYQRDTSPRIDALAAESMLFANAWAQSPWTKPSVPTLFTSLYPMQHGVYEGETPGSPGHLESDVLSAELRTIAEALRDAGYRTAAFVYNDHLPAEHGFDQGFELYEWGDFDAAEINRRFLEFLGREDPRPFFAYLHYLDVHWPFKPSAEFRDRFADSSRSELFDREDWKGLRDRINDGVTRVSDSDRRRLVDLHDAAIAELDARIGELLDSLRAQGRLEGTLILLTSDHGEELLDHGRVGHGSTLFEEVLRIPLMIRLPRAEQAGRRAAPARLLDLYPTLLGAAGLPRPDGLEGRDLLANSDPPGAIIAETRHKRTYRVSVRRGRWKYIRIYQASGAGPPEDRPETFGVAPGMRVKVSGRLEPDGSLSAHKLTARDAGDHDVELTGPVSRVDRGSGEFSIHALRVVPTTELRQGEARAILDTLEEGEWVKVEGDPSTGMTLLADELERLPVGERETELEGIIHALAPGPDDTAEARIGNLTVRLSRDTRIRGAVLRMGEALAQPKRRGDPFTPERLLSEEGLETESLLFDLETDPRELRDLSRTEQPRAAELHRDLALWFERMAQRRQRSGAERRRLDEEQIERLRELGYIE